MRHDLLSPETFKLVVVEGEKEEEEEEVLDVAAPSTKTSDFASCRTRSRSTMRSIDHAPCTEGARVTFRRRITVPMSLPALFRMRNADAKTPASSRLRTAALVTRPFAAWTEKKRAPRRRRTDAARVRQTCRNQHRARSGRTHRHTHTHERTHMSAGTCVRASPHRLVASRSGGRCARTRSARTCHAP